MTEETKLAPDEISNAETLAAFREIDEMKANGTGQAFNNLDDMWNSLEGLQSAGTEPEEGD